MKTFFLLFTCVVFGAFAGELQDKRVWTNTGGDSTRGVFVSLSDDLLELKTDSGKTIKIDVNTLCLEDVRLLYPTVSMDELAKPTQSKGLYNSKAAKENLLRRTRFFDFGRGKYGRLYAHGIDSVYFQDPSGLLFEWDMNENRWVKGLSAYINTCIRQIPPELNVARMKELGPWIEAQKAKDLERRVRQAEGAASEAQRRLDRAGVSRY